MNRYRAFTKDEGSLLRVLTTSCQISEAISVKELNEGKPHPPMLEFTAIWDTGASSTAISQRVVDALGLIPTGRGISKTAGGPIPVATYSVNVMLPTNVGFSSLPVSCNKMEPDILIGMDIISQGDLAVTNKQGKTVFTFQIPASHKIDFKAELEKYEKMHEVWIKHGNKKCPCGSGLNWDNCHGK